MTDNYLEDFTEPTPLVLVRIKGSWAFLPFETKVKILKALLNIDGKGETKLQYMYQVNELKDLALNDENPYIRYLIAQTISKPFIWGDREETDEDREDEARYQKVLSDKSELVRSAVNGRIRLTADNETAKHFWSLSHAERFMLVSSNSKLLFDLKGEAIAKILEYAATKLLPKKKVSTQEIMDVIQQFIYDIKESVCSIETHISEGVCPDTDMQLGEDMEALWKTAFLLPDELGFDLIENLPIKAGFMSEIPIGDAKKISEPKLCHLFGRDDVGLNELRRKFYTEKPSKKNKNLRDAAIFSLSFKLDDDDFKKLTLKDEDSKKEGKRKLEELRMLAIFCSGATLAQMEAIIGLIKDMPDEYFSGYNDCSDSYDDVVSARERQEYRVSKLGENLFAEELLDWRIYALASSLTNGYTSSAVDFLKSDVVSGDRWATYLKIRPKVISEPKLHSKLSVLRLGDKTYPAMEDEVDNYEDEKDDIAANTPDPTPSWQPHFKVLEKKIKTIFWITIAILVIVIAQSSI